MNKNTPTLNDKETIISEIKNQPIDTNTTDASRVTEDLVIVGIDEDNPEIVHNKEEDNLETEQIAIK